MEKKKCTLEELRQELLELWQEKGETYREMIPTYMDLLQQKRDARPRMNLDVIPKSILKEYPDIPLLRLEDKTDAETYISKLNEYGVRCVLGQIHNLKYDYTYATVRERIIQYRYELSRNGKRYSKVGNDPSYPAKLGPGTATSTGNAILP